MNSTKKMLYVGSFPGPIGGTTILTKLQHDILRNNRELTVFDTEGSKLISLLRTILFFKGDEIFVCVSSRGLNRFFLVLLFLAQFRNLKVFIRFYGGDFYKLRLPKNLTNTENIVFITETLGNIKYFQSKGYIATQLTNFRSLPKEKIPTKPRENYIFVGQIKSDKGVLEIKKAFDGLDEEIHFWGPCDWDVQPSDLEGNNSRYRGTFDLGSFHTVISEYKALIFPSQYIGESHAGVIVEAYSTKTPVITSRWQALPEIVIDGQTGFSFDSVSASNIIQAVLTFEKMNYEKLQDASFARYKKFHSETAAADRLDYIINFDGSWAEHKTTYLSP